MTSGKHLKLPNASACDTKPAPTAAAQGGFLLSLVRTQPNLSKVRHRVGTQLGCANLVLLVPTTASLEAEPRDELSYELGQIWAGMAGGTARDRSSPEHLLCPREKAKPDFSNEPLCLMEVAPKHALSKESGQIQLGQTGQVREQSWQEAGSPPPLHPMFHEGSTPSPSSGQEATSLSRQWR